MKINTTDKIKAIIFAVLAALFYAISIPVSKILLGNISPTFNASFLYLGAGLGIGLFYLFNFKKEDKEQRLLKSDFPYVIGMIVLDIAAPIILMFGISIGKAANASLLSNFEIVATALIALLIFKEKISRRIWVAIVLIIISSTLLSFEGVESFSFSFGSVLVILATVCWGFENNCTRKISNKSTYEIVFLKGIFSGLCSFVVALLIRDSFPEIKYILLAMALGFVSYGLSIFLYVKAQNVLGAAKTSSFYALAPFIGALISFIFIDEQLSYIYIIALTIMIFASIIVVLETIKEKKSQ